jgi:hypothetical protein
LAGLLTFGIGNTTEVFHFVDSVSSLFVRNNQTVRGGPVVGGGVGFHKKWLRIKGDCKVF